MADLTSNTFGGGPSSGGDGLNLLQAIAALRGQNAASVGSVPMGAPAQFAGYNNAGHSSVGMPDLSPPDISTALSQGADRATADVHREEYRGGSGAGPHMTGSGTPDEDVAASTSPGPGPLGIDNRVLNLARAMQPNASDRDMAIARAGIGMAQAGSHNSNFLAALSEGAGQGMDYFQKLRAYRAQQALETAKFQSEDQLRRAQMANFQSEAQVRMLPYQLAGLIDKQPGVGNMPGAGGPGLGGGQGPQLTAGAGAQPGGGTPQQSVPLPTANGKFWLPQGYSMERYNMLQRMLALPAGVDMGDKAAKELRDIYEMSPDYQQAKAEAVGKGEVASGKVLGNPSEGQRSVPPGGLGPGGGGGGGAGPGGGGATPVARPQLFDPKVLALIPQATPTVQPQNFSERSQFEESEKKLGARPSEIDEGANTAKMTNFTLGNMFAASNNWDMGKLANVNMNTKQYLTGLNNQLPEGHQFDLSKWNDSIANYQDFTKNGIDLTRQIVRQTSSRAAFQEMQLLSGAVPNSEMTRPGFNLVGSQLRGAADYAQAQQKAKDLWMAANSNNMHGFDSWYGSSIDPAVFALRRLHQVDPAAAQKAVDYMKTVKLGNGTAWDRLQKQTSYAKSLGLFDELD